MEISKRGATTSGLRRLLAETRSSLAMTFPYSGHWLLTWYGLFLSGPRFFHQAYKHSALLWPTPFPRLH